MKSFLNLFAMFMIISFPISLFAGEKGSVGRLTPALDHFPTQEENKKLGRIGDGSNGLTNSVVVPSGVVDDNARIKGRTQTKANASFGSSQEVQAHAVKGGAAYGELPTPDNFYRRGITADISAGWTFVLPQGRRSVCTSAMVKCAAGEGKGSGFAFEFGIGYTFGKFFLTALFGLNMPKFPMGESSYTDSYNKVSTIFAEIAPGVFPFRFSDQINPSPWLRNLVVRIGVGYSKMGNKEVVVSGLFSEKNVDKEKDTFVTPTQVSLSASVGTAYSVGDLQIGARLGVRVLLKPAKTLAITPLIYLRW